MNSTSPPWKVAGLIIPFVFLVSVACAGFSSFQETDTLARTQTSLASTSDALQTAAYQSEATQPPTPEQPTQTQPEIEIQAEQTEPPPPMTPSGPTINASVNTNCRAGPSADYKVLGYLLKNQVSEVRGRDNLQIWWYIENPEKSGEYCWVWGETTQIQGDISGLPIITPSPPPAPQEVAFTASYTGINSCGGKADHIFQINNGDSKLESMSFTLEFVSGGAPIFGPATHNAPFMTSNNECPPVADILPPGASGYVGGGELSGAVAVGTTFRATIKLCSENDMKGVCQTLTVEYTPY